MFQPEPVHDPRPVAPPDDRVDMETVELVVEQFAQWNTAMFVECTYPATLGHRYIFHAWPSETCRKVIRNCWMDGNMTETNARREAVKILCDGEYEE